MPKIGTQQSLQRNEHFFNYEYRMSSLNVHIYIGYFI